MTPGSELDRLFDQVLQSIPKPDPLASTNAMRVTFDGKQLQAEQIDPRDMYIDPIDADETNYGVCAQGESDE
ncbi:MULTISPECIES: hypothetical protein [unclassified Stenotrophomonas]|uniref:hypothetical protein n=1 Tax=unclassified Stenotrophomonas TaxID=196198 RepID=UPI003012E1D0